MTDLVAALPWYDLPATAPWLNNLWYNLRRILASETGLTFAKQLDRERSPSELWQAQNTVLCQCCGPDLFTTQGSDLIVIATPILSNLACEPGRYFSHIVASNTYNLSNNARLAVNSPSSWSGHFALRQWLRSANIQESTVVFTGSHRASLEAIVRGQADLAAIDACSFSHFESHPKNLVIVGQSTEQLAPPFVCHRDIAIPVEVISAALTEALALSDEGKVFSSILPATRQDYQSFKWQQ